MQEINHNNLEKVILALIETLVIIKINQYQLNPKICLNKSGLNKTAKSGLYKCNPVSCKVNWTIY